MIPKFLPLNKKSSYKVSKKWQELFLDRNEYPYTSNSADFFDWVGLAETSGALRGAKAEKKYLDAAIGPTHFWTRQSICFEIPMRVKPTVDVLVNMIEEDGLDSVCLACLDESVESAWTFVVTHESELRFVFKGVGLKGAED